MLSFWPKSLPFGRIWQSCKNTTTFFRPKWTKPNNCSISSKRKPFKQPNPPRACRLLVGTRKVRGGAKAAPEPSKQLVVPAPRDQPHIPKKVYVDCRHRINDKEVERQRSPIRINAKLRDSRLKALGNKSPIRKARGLQSTEDSESEYVPSKTSSTYRSATPTRYSEARPVSPQKHLEDYNFEEIPSQDLVVQLLFQKVQKMENDRVRSQELDWGKLRPPFTERIKRSRQVRDIQPLRIPFYIGVKDPLTHLHSFQSAIGCNGLSDEGQCFLFPSALTRAALNWFY
ncbi:unnamed protein product [Prunus armeniaca]